MTGRILVLEDDENVLTMVRDMLGGAGYEVIGLRYPELVIDVMAHEEPDLVLLDVMLPQKSGIEVADQLWTNGFGSTPLIGMSASTIMVDLARGTPFFQEVVRKPFDMDALLGEVQRVLSEHNPTLALPAATL